MYLETMQQIYGNVTKVLVESRQGSNLLYLPLDKIMQGLRAAQGRWMRLQRPVRLRRCRPRRHLPPFPNDSRARDTSRTRERESR